MNEINFWAVLVAAVSSFLLGGLWYSPALFGRAWNRAAGLGQPPATGHPAKVFGISFLLALVAAGLFAYLLGPRPDVGTALLQGLVVGAGFVAASFGINYQFANRSPVMWVIDGGYHTTQFVLFGLVLGLWP